jgi:hypothetical protein
LTSSRAEVRVYHVSPWRRWVLWYVFGPLIVGLLFLGLSVGAGERQPFLLTAGLVFLIALPFQFLIDRARLEISTEGVRLKQTGYQLALADSARSFTNTGAKRVGSTWLEARTGDFGRTHHCNCDRGTSSRG